MDCRQRRSKTACVKRWKDLRRCVMQGGLIPAISMPEVMTMKASVLCDVQRLEVRDIPRPVISPYEVLIRVAAVGLCGTDAHIFAGHANYNTNEYGQQIPLTVQPQILGHEIAGIVEEVGSAGRDL